MIQSDRERQAPTRVEDAEPTHVTRYQFALSYIRPTDEVLDVPCGSGYGTRVLSGKAQQVLGMDIESQAIAHAQEFFATSNTTFTVGDMELLSSVLPGSQNVVVSFEGIEHIPHPEVFLSEIYRVLKPEGLLIISTPRKPHGSPYHIIEFSLEEYRAILAQKFMLQRMYGQIYTDIFDMDVRQEDPHAYKKFNFIALCRKEK